MNDTFAQRVRCAAIAAWWTVLIGLLSSVLGWSVWLVFLHTHPDWVVWMMGGEFQWSQIQRIAIAMITAIKFFLLVCILVAIWLSLWSRRLKRLTPL